jgi:hypothetical protein
MRTLSRSNAWFMVVMGTIWPYVMVYYSPISVLIMFGFICMMARYDIDHE